MARHNDCHLLGRVSRINAIKDAHGHYASGRFMLHTLSGFKNTGTGQTTLREEFALIISFHPEIVADIASLQENDIVDVYGVLSTIDTDKKTQCPHCGKETIRKGVNVHITPIDMIIVQRNLRLDEANDFLKKHHKRANSISLVGMVTEKPNFFRTQSGHSLANFRLKVGRKFKLKNDSTTKSDFIMIRSYGKAAESNAECLNGGSYILTEGYVQTRNYVKKMDCAHCGSYYEINDLTMEAIPYSVEYLSNYEKPRQSVNPILPQPQKIEDNEKDIVNALQSNSDVSFIEFN